jgi:hypothetical protein
MADHLICGTCGFSNEPERVYCHSCGAKLDRSLLPAVAADTTSESAQSARKRIKKLTNPASYSVAHFLKSLLKTLLYAAIAAVIYLVSQKPAGVPEEKNEITRLVQSDLMDATQSPTARMIAFTEAEVNGALKQSLRRAAPGGIVPGVEFQRAFARLHPDLIHLGTQQSLFGYPIYSGVDYRLTVAEGKFTPVLLGGSFGRLPIHVALMQYLDFAYQKLWDALKRERAQMDRMQNVTIREGQIVFVTKPAAPR